MKEVQTVPGIQFHNSVTKLACSLTFGAYAQEFPAVFFAGINDRLGAWAFPGADIRGECPEQVPAGQQF